MIIGITGTIGAGKGEAAKFFEKRGFEHYSVREFLIKELENKGYKVNRDNMVKVANELRKDFGPSYIVDQLYVKARANGGNAVIESIRTEGEIESLRAKGNFYLISIDALIDIRYARFLKANSETDGISKKKFEEDEEREAKSLDPNKQNIQRCMELSDFWEINNLTVEMLHSKLERICRKIGC